MANDLKIPLHSFHEKHGARFVPFGGWLMPVQYSGILDEHRAVRETAGLFDVSHMGEFIVTGADSSLFLDKLLVNRIAGTKIGKAVYSPMCNSSGGVIDDLIVYRTSEEGYLVCVNAGNIEKDFGWFLKQAKRWNLDVLIEDQSDDFALLALQGPNAEAILTQIGFQDLSNLNRFSHHLVAFGSGKVRICRTGYTGEDGFEIYLPIKLADHLANEIMSKGNSHGLRLCGLGARDSLRLEAGFPLYGHELTETISPLEAGLSWTVKFDKKDFIGKNALTEQRELSVPRKIVHFRLSGRRIAREGTVVLNENNQEVGHVCSGTLSPMSNAPIGSALIRADSNNAELKVELRGHKLTLEVATPPLHHQIK